MRAQRPRVWSLLSSQVSGTPALEVGLSRGCSGVWGAGTETQNSRETEIWGRQTGGGHPLRAGLSPPLPVRLPGTGAEKSGVCPALEVDLNCTQECLSDGECADNLKCCRAGCATVCQMPNGNPGGPTRGRGWRVTAAPGSGAGALPTQESLARSRWMDPDPPRALPPTARRQRHR